MTIKGIIKGGVVILPDDVRLPEGTSVTVETEQELSAVDPFVEAASQAGKPRPHWPKDFVTNHGHYVSGEPLKP